MQNAAITFRSLGSAFDDDTGGRAISHPLSSLLVEGCPCGADLSSAFGAPLLQGGYSTGMQKTQSARKISIVRNTRIPLSPHKSLPRVGKVASEARRIGCWRYENERDKASQVSEMRTPLPTHPLLPRCGSQPPPLRGTSFQRKEGECRPSPPSPYGESGDRRVPLFPPYRHFERMREIFFVRGQAKVGGQREAGSTVFLTTCNHSVSRKLIHVGNRKRQTKKIPRLRSG